MDKKKEKTTKTVHQPRTEQKQIERRNKKINGNQENMLQITGK